MKKGVKTLFCLLIVMFNLCIAQNQHKIDSLKFLLKTVKEDTTRVNYLNTLCREFKNMGLYDTAHLYGQSAQQLAQKIDFKKGLGKAYNNTGLIYYEQGNYSEGLKCYLAALKIRKELGDKKEIAGSYNNIGLLYYELGDYPTALKNHLSALKLVEEIGDKKRLAGSYNNIGLIYEKLGNYPEALKNHLAAQKIEIEFGDKNEIAASYNNIGTIYSDQGKYDEALKNHLIALKMREELGAKKGIKASYTNIGIIYLRLKNYPEALKNYFTALKIAEEIGDKKGIAGSYHNIGSVYRFQKEYAKAIPFLQKGIQLSKEIGTKELVRDMSKIISEIYSQTGDYKSAYEFYRLNSQFKDSILNEHNGKQMAEMQTKYETKNKQKEIELLLQKSENQQLQLSRNRYLITGLCLAALLIVIITFLVLQKNKLRASQAKIELEQKLVLSQTKALHSQMNPHFIFNCMASIQSFMTQNDPVSSAKYLSKFARLIRATLENSQQPFVTLESEIKMLEDYMALEALRFVNKFTFTIFVDDSVDVEITKIPSMFVQPYIENAIIHGVTPKNENDGMITISFKAENSILFCVITDNGIGRKRANEIKEAMGLVHKSLGMSITEERLQLINIKENTQVYSKITDIEDKNGVPMGTKVEISLPLSNKKTRA